MNAKLDRYQSLFRGRGQHQVADWMAKLRDHVNAVGVEHALDALGDDRGAGGRPVPYEGVVTDTPNWQRDADFIAGYLDHAGVAPVEFEGGTSGGVSSWIPSDGTDRQFAPAGTEYETKLDEAKMLPGLESSEDVSKLVGKQVTHFTPDVVAKLDETYGAGKWIVKTYSPDEAYAGFGIYFPQRAAKIAQDARETIWHAGEALARYGFALDRDGAGKVVGLAHSGGDKYRFGSKRYEETIDGDARHWADRAAAAADHERGTRLPNGGDQFMAQPAFPVVGVTEADRAAGRTWEGNKEARVHVVTRGGRAEVVPHATWIKGDHLPVVFEDDDTRAMAKAAQDAIDAIPAGNRAGQIYAPDVVRTADGYKVVELNPTGTGGGSGYLEDNPMVIDSYVSHLVGRTPLHVRFVRALLSGRDKSGRPPKS